MVIRLSSLGDVILTTPLLKILKQQYPDARIDYCTKEEFASVLKFNPNIDNLIPVDNNIDFGGLRDLKKSVKKAKYDLIIDLHSNLRTFYLTLFTHAKLLKFRKNSFRKFLLVNFKINLMKKLPPISERYIQTLNMMRDKPADKYNIIPEIYTDENSRKKVDSLFKELNIPADSKLICIIPRTRHFTKTYPAEYFAELITQFDKSYRFLLVGKGNDKINIDIIKSKTSNKVFDLYDKLSVLELAEVMKRCSLVISGDTGPMHIAESLNIPLIMIAGSSVKEFGFYPQSKNCVVIENEELSCRPCSHIGRSECPLKHFKCMREIFPSSIFAKAEIFMSPDL